MRLTLKTSFLLACTAFMLCACAERDRYIAVSGYAQGGVYTVKLNLKGVRMAPKSIQCGIDSILTLVDTTLSGYNKGSMLSRFNSAESVKPNHLFLDIYNYSAELFEQTGGSLDVASGPLFDLWGFGFTTDSLPSGEQVDAVRATCGMGRLKRDMGSCVIDGALAPESLIADGGTALPRLNYNAVAQGYTCDLVASYLHSLGVHDMLVDIGEIYCEGHNPAGHDWTIGVDRPIDGNESPGEDLDGKWCSGGKAVGIVTSGNYRKFYIRDGRKYAHTIDPRTGEPVQHNLLSATIVAPTAADADAFATYCMVIGLDAAREFISSRSDLEGYLIYDSEGQMKEWASEGFSVVTSR